MDSSLSTSPQKHHTTLRYTPRYTPRDLAHAASTSNTALKNARDLHLTPTIAPRTAPDITPAPISSQASEQSLQQNSDCLLVGEALAICGFLTPGFANLLSTAQAKCLCYSNTIWAPSIFDNAVATCVGFAETAAPTAFGQIKGLKGFCGELGDVEGQQASNAGSIGGTIDGAGIAATTTTTSVTFTTTRAPDVSISDPTTAVSVESAMPTTALTQDSIAITETTIEIRTSLMPGLDTSALVPHSPILPETASIGIPNAASTVPTPSSSLFTDVETSSPPAIIAPSSILPTIASSIPSSNSGSTSSNTPLPIPSTNRAPTLTTPRSTTSTHRPSITSKSSSQSTKSKTTSVTHSTTATGMVSSKAVIGPDESSVGEIVSLSFALAVLVLFL